MTAPNIPLYHGAMNMTKQKNINTWDNFEPALSASPLFAGIEPKSLSAMLYCLGPRLVHCRKGDILALQGEPFTGIGCVLEGQVAVLKENYAGARVLLTRVDVGGLFGEMAAYAEPVWPATVQAAQDGVVMFLPKDKITGSCGQNCSWHHALVDNLLRILSRKALLLNRKLEYAAIKTMRGKLCAFLLDRYAEAGNALLVLGMNRNELSEYLDVSRPSMSRELSRMRDEGLIDFHLATVRLKDIGKLREMAQ